MPIETEKPVNKKAKTSNTASTSTTTRSKIKAPSKTPARRSRVLGKLANLMEVPVDVFTEICFHLFPIDLLHLAWTSKRIRSILMSKTARSTWRRAREEQLPTLPPCPDDLSEPQYIALLFSTICQECGGTRAQRTHFCLRIRHCAPCYRKYVGTVDEARKKYGANIIAVVEALPRDSTSRGTIVSFTALEMGLSTYRTLHDTPSQIEFIRSLVEKSREVRKHAEKVLKWQSEQDRIKMQHDEETIETRWNSIQKKLVELGWEERDFPRSDNSEWKKLTRKNQVLTDKVWKNLYPKLETMLEDRQAMRILIEWQELCRRRTAEIQHLYSLHKTDNAKPDLLYPAEPYILNVASIKQLAEADGSEFVTTAEWEACIPELEDALRRGTEVAVQKVKMWYRTYNIPKEDNGTKGINSKIGISGSAGVAMSNKEEPPDMSLVTSVFKCSECQQALWLATFHQHDHFATRYEWDQRFSYETYFPGVRGPGTAALDLGLQKMVSTLLTASGLDPLTASVEDVVLKPGDIYACGRCDDEHQEPVAFGKLVSHHMAEELWYQKFIKKAPYYTDRHNFKPGERFEANPLVRRLAPEQAVTLKKNYRTFMESFEQKEELVEYNSNQYWSLDEDEDDATRVCEHCHYESGGKYSYSIGRMIIHLLVKHGIVVDTDSLDDEAEEHFKECDYDPGAYYNL